jgi:hypothetical protein
MPAIIVNNDTGEVHFHFHGAAPPIVTPPAAKPPHAETAGPKGPGKPAKAKDDGDDDGDGDDKPEKRID